MWTLPETSYVELIHRPDTALMSNTSLHDRRACQDAGTVMSPPIYFSVANRFHKFQQPFKVSYVECLGYVNKCYVQVVVLFKVFLLHMPCCENHCGRYVIAVTPKATLTLSGTMMLYSRA